MIEGVDDLVSGWPWYRCDPPVNLQGHPEIKSRCPVCTRSRPIATTNPLQRDETVRCTPMFTDGEPGVANSTWDKSW